MACKWHPCRHGQRREAVFTSNDKENQTAQGPQTLTEWAEDQQRILDAAAQNDWQSLAIIAPAGTGKTTVLEEISRRFIDRGPVLYLVATHQAKAYARERLPEDIDVYTFFDLAQNGVPGSSSTESWSMEQLRTQISEQLDQFGTLYADDIQDWMRQYCYDGGDKSWAQWAAEFGQDTDGTGERTRLEALVHDGETLWQACDARPQPLPYLMPMLLKRFIDLRTPVPYQLILIDEAENANPMIHKWLDFHNVPHIIAADPAGTLTHFDELPELWQDVPANRVFTLSASYRASAPLAELITRVMNWRNLRPALTGHSYCEVKVQDSIVGRRPLTLIARYNMSLLDKMIDISMAYQSTFLYFYWDASGVWQDVNSAYRLWARERGFSWIWQGEKWTNYHDWLQKMTAAKNREAMALAGLIKKYGRRLPVIMQQVQNQIVDAIEPTTVVLSTAANAKGREWDMVQILDDFVPLPQLSPAYASRRQSRQNALAAATAEYEVNLLYLAMTRARRMLWIPSSVENWLKADWQTFFSDIMTSQQRALWGLHEDYGQTAAQVVHGGKWTAEELAEAWQAMREHWLNWSGGKPWPGDKTWK